MSLENLQMLDEIVLASFGKNHYVLNLGLVNGIFKRRLFSIPRFFKIPNHVATFNQDGSKISISRKFAEVAEKYKSIYKKITGRKPEVYLV